MERICGLLQLMEKRTGYSRYRRTFEILARKKQKTRERKARI